MTNDDLSAWLAFQADARAEMALFDGLPPIARKAVSGCRFPWNLRQIAEVWRDWAGFIAHVLDLPEAESRIVREEGDMVPLEGFVQ